MKRCRPAARLGGFTLIELMVVVVIATILLAVSVPAYMAQVRKSRRTEAKTALLDLAGREERYFNTNNAYTNVAANLGYAATGSSATVSNLSVGSGYYQVTICVPATCVPNGQAAPSYGITATPLTADQLKDTQCLLFTLDNTGNQTANSQTNGGGTSNTTLCWSSG